MIKYLYYYKRNNGDWVFQDGQVLKDREAIEHLISKRKEGYTTWRFYLDLPEDFQKIKELFFTKEYWDNTNAEEEANHE